jgi:nucleoside-diphosphate-sugar epimerase
MMRGDSNRVLGVGNLKTQRVVIDVRDCVRAYYLLMKEDSSDGEVYNVCGSDLREMEYFTDKMIEYSGLDIEKVINPKFYRPIDIQVQVGATEKLHGLTGWKPEIDIETTLLDLLNYWRAKMDDPKRC